MSKGRILALAAVQWLIFLIILFQWSDKSVSELLTSYNVLPGYAMIQLYLHWGLWDKLQGTEL